MLSSRTDLCLVGVVLLGRASRGADGSSFPIDQSDGAASDLPLESHLESSSPDDCLPTHFDVQPVRADVPT